MSSLLLVVFPLAMAAGCFVLRRSSQLVGLIGVLAIAIELWLAVSAPINRPARLLELGVSYTELGRLFLATLCIGSLIVAATAAMTPITEYFVPTTLLLLAGTAALLLIQEPFVVAALLLLLGLIGSVQLVDQPLDSGSLVRPAVLSMTIKYTLLIALGGLLLLISFVLATAYERQLVTSGPTLNQAVFGLVLVGFSLRLGLVPFHWWLPDLVEETLPPTFFLQVGFLSVLAVPVLLVVLQTQPHLLVNNPGGQRLLIGLGGLSALLGSGFAIFTSSVRRAIAFICIAHLGLLVIGLGIPTVMGVSAALLGALNHVIGLALLALGLTLLERAVPGRREQAGMLRERPLAAAIFALGVLLLLGVPPLVGFVPKLLLIDASRAAGPGMTWLVIAGLGLLALAGARLLRRVLLQPRDTPTTRSLFSDDLERLGVVQVGYAPRPVLALMIGLGVGVLVLGVWPQPIMAQLDAAVRTLAFLSQ